MDLSWFKKKPLPVMIDTSIWVGEKFNLTSEKFDTLQEAVKSGNILIVTTEILKREFLKHAQLQIDAEHNSIKSLVVARTAFSNSYGVLERNYSNFSAENLWEECEGRFGFVDITSDVHWRHVFDDYFESRPPFQQKKKSEFPDSFNLKMLEAKSYKKLVVLSGDSDFDDWISLEKGRVKFNSLKKFIDDYVRVMNPELTSESDEVITVIMGSLLSDLKMHYSDTSFFDIISWHSEIVSADITDLNLKHKYIQSIDVEQKIVKYFLFFEGSADLEISSSVDVFDSVDRESLTLGYNKNFGQTHFSIILELNVEIGDDGNDYQIEDETFNAEDYEPPPEWESFLDQ